jgi:glucose/arabinose dehydrogenase
MTGLPRLSLSLAVAGIALIAPASPALGATLPPGFTESTLAAGLSVPTSMDIAPDGRIFVTEQGGRVRLIKNGALLASPFLDLSGVVDWFGERGLLGIVVDPGFAANGFVYLYYTDRTLAVNRVIRVTASGDAAVPGSQVVLLDGIGAANIHNAGAMHFGLDGKLYVGVGDAAVSPNAQTLANLNGKLLRLNADGSVPPDNPFVTSAGGPQRAIWAIGLRNPFTFAVQPGTGRVLINDVGLESWEEINDGVAGSNYGWPVIEGPGPAATSGYQRPLFAYQHGTQPSVHGCAITGGTFYDPPAPQFPASYVGKYFFADYCSGWIHVLDPEAVTRTAFASGISRPVDLDVGPDGSLYYLAIGDGTSTGTVRRVRYTASQAPTITSHPASQTVPVGNAATFSVAASGTAPLAYQWQRNGADIAGATGASLSVGPVGLGDSDATFRAIVTNVHGMATSDPATLTVTGNAAPAATITAPTAGTLYAGGDTISYAGSAVDAEDGPLPASAFTWWVDFHHDAHVHPFIPPTSGSKSGSFTVPTNDHTAASVWFRIHLSVRDSGGLTHSTSVDVRPRTATLTLETRPAGLQVTLDGVPVTTPASVPSVVGVTRTLGAAPSQTSGRSTYVLEEWSDGGAATHAIVTPAASTTYTATYDGQRSSKARDPRGPDPSRRQRTGGERPRGTR